MKKILIIIILSLLVLGAAGYLSFRLYQRLARIRQEQIESKNTQKAWQNLERNIPGRINNFNGIAGIVIKDLKRGYALSVNENIPLPSASLVKIPIMAACFYAASEGKINLKSYLMLKSNTKVTGSGILKNYPAGTQVTIEKLIHIMIAESDNTASNMLIELLGFDYLNDTFKKLGLNNSNIVRKMMDFQSRRQGRENYTTAADMAYILEQMYRGKFLNRETSLKCIDILKDQRMHDRIPARLPSGTPVAHKTGLERGICHDVGIIFTPKGDILICALTRHKSKTSRAAKNFISYVAQDAYNYLTGL